MPKRTPSYRQRPGYDQAIVTLTDSATKKRRDYWLGEYGSPASRERYHRLIAEWEAGGRRLPPTDFDQPPTDVVASLTIDELALRFWRWAEGYYQTRHAGTLKVMIRLLRQYYGQTAAAEFGPSKLRLLREAMIRGDESADPPRSAWSRRYVNQQVMRVRQLFKWGASHELLSSSIHQALTTVEPLKRGRTTARENDRVGPVPQPLLDGTLPHLNRQVRAIVELQLFTGARAGELLGMRAIDIEMHDDDEVWVYRPQEHKNAYREMERVIYLGPRAQELVRPFLANRAIDAYLFSPAEAEAERRASVHAARKTPLSCGNRPGTNRRAAPRRSAGDRYTTPSYYRAIRYACDRAFPPPAPLAKKRDETYAEREARLTPEQKAELEAWRIEHRWHPHQLRHNAGTNIRKEFGLEAAQLALGHASAQITDAVYAERDRAKVVEVMRKIG